MHLRVIRKRTSHIEEIYRKKSEKRIYTIVTFFNKIFDVVHIQVKRISQNVCELQKVQCDHNQEQIFIVVNKKIKNKAIQSKDLYEIRF